VSKTNKWERVRRMLFLFFLVATPIVLWLLPTDYFDNSTVELCPSKALFDIECWGCGITRAVMHFHHLEIGGAIYYNFLVVGVYPFLVWLWYKMLSSGYRKLKSME
jgi:hypothetical protein